MPDAPFNQNEEVFGLGRQYLQRMSALPPPSGFESSVVAFAVSRHRRISSAGFVAGGTIVLAVAGVAVVAFGLHRPHVSNLPAATQPGGGGTHITVAGPIDGEMQNPLVICQSPQRDSGSGVGQGFMSVAGTINGLPEVVTVWSTGRNQPSELYVGARPGDITYGPIGPDPGSTISGVTGFDWNNGAALDVQLTEGNPSRVAPQATATVPLHVVGRIVCPAPTPAPASPTPAPVPSFNGTATHLTFSGPISGEMQNITVTCQQHIPEADGGAMTVAGTVNGVREDFAIMSVGSAPNTPIETYIFVGGTPGAQSHGQFAQNGVPTVSGVTGFDWIKGATIGDAALPDQTWIGHASAEPSPALPAVHVTGQIVCGTAQPSPSPTAAP